MTRSVALVSVMILTLGVAVNGGSFEFCRAGDAAIGFFNNLTGQQVNGLLLRLAEPVYPSHCVGVGAHMEITSISDTEILYEGFVVPGGTWEVDWKWDGLKLESAAWLVDGEVIYEIDVHMPTARGLAADSHQECMLRFEAVGSIDPDGFPLLAVQWQFEDGVVLEGGSVSRQFDGSCEGIVRLTVSDVEGKDDECLVRYEATERSTSARAAAPKSGLIFVVGLASDGVFVIDPTTDEVLKIDVGDRPGGITMSNDKIYVSNTNDATVSVIDPAALTVTATLDLPAGRPLEGDYGARGLFASDGYVYVMATGSTVHVIDAATDSFVASIAVGGNPNHMVFFEEKAYVANAANSTPSTVSIIDTSNLTLAGTIEIPDPPPTGQGPFHIAVIDGKAYVANKGWGAEPAASRAVTVIDVETDQVLSTITVDMGPMYIAETGEGEAYVACWLGHYVDIIDTTSNSLIGRLGTRFYPNAVHVSDGRAYVTHVNVYEGEGQVSIYDTELDSRITTVHLGPNTGAGDIVFYEGEAYVGVPGSGPGYVVVIDEDTSAVARVISGVGDPHQMLLYER